MELLITAESRPVTCPVCRAGDRIVLRVGYRLDLQESDTAVQHSLASVRPCCNAVARVVAPEDLGLADQWGTHVCSVWTRGRKPGAERSS